MGLLNQPQPQGGGASGRPGTSQPKPEPVANAMGLIFGTDNAQEMQRRRRQWGANLG
jgi:hypothetical protein